jgi:hypothetical protein
MRTERSQDTRRRGSWVRLVRPAMPRSPADAFGTATHDPHRLASRNKCAAITLCCMTHKVPWPHSLAYGRPLTKAISQHVRLCGTMRSRLREYINYQATHILSALQLSIDLSLQEVRDSNEQRSTNLEHSLWTIAVTHPGFGVRT